MDLSRRTFFSLAAAVAAVSTLPPMLFAEPEISVTVFEDPTSLYARINASLERALATFRDDPNDHVTRMRVIRTAQAVMDQFQMHTREVYDYLIVCDERNNPPAVVDTQLPQIDVVYKPSRSLECFILHPRAGVTNWNV